MGPMSFADYQRMLPPPPELCRAEGKELPTNRAGCERTTSSGASFRRLRDWVRFYTSDQYSWDVQLVLTKAEVPVTQMGRAGRLGWTTWLKTKPFDHDAEDLVLQGAA